MDYRLTPIATDAPIPTAAAADPLSQQVHRSVFMGKLEDVLHKAVGWGRKNSLWPYNFGLSCCYVEMATAFTAPHAASIAPISAVDPVVVVGKIVVVPCLACARLASRTASAVPSM